MPAVEFETLEDNIARVTLNRPERLNAIDGSLIDGVDDALDALSGGEFRVAILTGAGRGFCAGADLSGTGEAWTKAKPTTPAFKVNYDSQVRLADLFTRIYELPIPMIAAVNGVAVGGGLAFTLVSDVRVASENARFGSAFIKAGFSSMDMGTSYLLPKIVGAGVARELMLTGRIIDAAEAYRIKLVHEVVAPDDLLPAALRLPARSRRTTRTACGRPRSGSTRRWTRRVCGMP
jgi:enoyl-CoA hydratase/carnithine racemase